MGTAVNDNDFIKTAKDIIDNKPSSDNPVKIKEHKHQYKASKIPVRQKKAALLKNGDNNIGAVEDPIKSQDEEKCMVVVEELSSGFLGKLQSTSENAAIISVVCADKKVNTIVPEDPNIVLSYRDHDNACTTETGDTTGRTKNNHDATSTTHQSAIINSNQYSSAAEDNECSTASMVTHVGAPANDTMAASTPPPGGRRDDAIGASGGCASIAIGAADCAQASGCSRVSTASVCVALHPGHHRNSSCAQPPSPTANEDHHLIWSFKDGRLVFDQQHSNGDLVDNIHLQNGDDVNKVLYSKHVNRKTNQQRSRLKHLEEKLKRAGLHDESLDDDEIDKTGNNNSAIIEQVVDKSAKLPNYDANQNLLLDDDGEEVVSSCQFDVRQVAAFPSELNGACWKVYDELADEDLIMRGDTMGPDEKAKQQHNPDHDNLKSLLKRPGKNREKRASNRVVFNENKNEFFDADYIILIREECEYDDEDDDSVCTCSQHEMVRLTCCEPNCNCTLYDGYDQTPQSPKFAPPLEFVDAVTLSPPEGYKDMELEEQQLLALEQIVRKGQRTAVCKECSVVHDNEDGEDDESQSENEDCHETNPVAKEQEEKEKTDQSQQTTPTTPPNDSETITMTTVTEQRIVRKNETSETGGTAGGSPINGILKGGRLWKQQSLEVNAFKPLEPQQMNDASDEECNGRRSVRFIESQENPTSNSDGTVTPDHNETVKPEEPENNCNNTSVSPESTEMMLTFKLGNHVLISNNSLKPNSAVRQLFPCTQPLNGKEDEQGHQYLVTAESLRAFEEAKRAKLPQIIQSGETDESIKRAIERNTLRRSLIRYEPRSKKSVQKTDNSLVERIKQLTCDIDDAGQEESVMIRASPTGEETPDDHHHQVMLSKNDKSFSPSSSSTTSSNSSSMSSTYKKITDLFGKREKLTDAQNNLTNEQKPAILPPDLGNGGSHLHEIGNHCPVGKMTAQNNENRKQFLAPLTACVSSMANTDEYYYNMTNQVGERASVASSVGTEYSLEDIDEGLKTGDDESKKITPDVLAGTPSASESGDELAIFVQQDASRIERIKKKYQPEQQSSKETDDEHDDYGFNKRPSVRGIKPRFGSTTEILQQIQDQIQPAPPVPAARIAWPYYSESGLKPTIDNTKTRQNINQNYQNYANVPEEVKSRNMAGQYRPTSLQDESMYQNCVNQRCVREVYSKANGNQLYSTVMKTAGGGCSTEYYHQYQSLPRVRNGRPLSPPPLELSKNYHQTMVYIPYNHIEGYQPPSYYPSNDYVRVTNQNQINQRYIDPIYQQRTVHVDEHHVLSPMPFKPMVRVPLMASSRSESPIPGQFSTARATQTPLVTVSACNYYPGGRFRPAWPAECSYVAKAPVRHSFPGPVIPRYGDDSEHVMNGFRQSVDITVTAQQKDSVPSSPVKPRFLERGVPEGAAASGPLQDSQSSTMTSPTSPQNPPNKPLFYAMNV